MSNTTQNNLIDRAIEVATKAHRGQVRNGTDIPYISHPYAVGLLLARAGLPDEVVAAGILHDTVEDTDLTLEYIRDHFGDTVALIVEGCSEPDKRASWEARKQHTLDYLRTAPWEGRVVACADKLHNVRAIRREHDASGDAVWARFNRGRAEQEWYYRGLVDSLCRLRDGNMEVPFCEQFTNEVEKLFGSS